jgi:hypothetical protein
MLGVPVPSWCRSDINGFVCHLDEKSHAVGDTVHRYSLDTWTMTRDQNLVFLHIQYRYIQSNRYIPVPLSWITEIFSNVEKSLPIFLQVLITLQAISPLLAIRILSNVGSSGSVKNESVWRQLQVHLRKKTIVWVGQLRLPIGWAV